MWLTVTRSAVLFPDDKQMNDNNKSRIGKMRDPRI